MDRHRPRLDQINIVSGNPEASIAFYRRLGVDIAEDGIWRTPSGRSSPPNVKAAASD
jgi:hypothetical protein